MSTEDDGRTAKPSEDPSDPSSERSEQSSSGDIADWMEALREMAPYLDLGWRLAGSAAFPPLLGHFLVDVWAGTSPWGLLGGAVVGLAAAILQLKHLQEELDR